MILNISLFNRKYWVRRFDEQQEIRGYITATHKDFVASLHVHPSGSDKVTAQPEGARKMKYLEGHGNIPLNVADEAKNQKGDLLFYKGEWYDCVACQCFDHTLLGHYNYQFALVPKDASRSNDVKGEPVIDPNTVKEGIDA